MSSRKHDSVPLGDGAYYHPKASVGSLDHNRRFLFLRAIEEAAPEVLGYLRSEIWPRYFSFYMRALPLPPYDIFVYTIHPQFALSWMAGETLPGWTPRARKVITELGKLLFAWTSKFEIHSYWMLNQGLNTMLGWTMNDGTPANDQETNEVARQIDELLWGGKGDRATNRERIPDEMNGRKLSWGVERRWFFPTEAERHFAYDGWRGQEVSEYERVVLADFKQHLSPYLDSIRSKATELPKTPILSRPERFKMLALYLCRQMSLEDVATAGFNKDRTAIYRDIRAVANLLGLPLRRPGRRKTLSSS